VFGGPLFSGRPKRVKEKKPIIPSRGNAKGPGSTTGDFSEKRKEAPREGSPPGRASGVIGAGRFSKLEGLLSNRVSPRGDTLPSFYEHGWRH